MVEIRERESGENVYLKGNKISTIKSALVHSYFDLAHTIQSNHELLNEDYSWGEGQNGPHLMKKPMHLLLSRRTMTHHWAVHYE